MNRIWSLIERTLGLVAIAALAALVLLPSWQVILRDFFNAPLIGLEEATRWGLIILVFLAAPLLLSTNEQIRLAEFINYLPAMPRKLRDFARKNPVETICGSSSSCVARARSRAVG